MQSPQSWLGPLQVTQPITTFLTFCVCQSLKNWRTLIWYSNQLISMFLRKPELLSTYLPTKVVLCSTTSGHWFIIWYQTRIVSFESEIWMLSMYGCVGVAGVPFPLGTIHILRQNNFELFLIHPLLLSIEWFCW